MYSQWFKRSVRLWLVILLPIGIYCAYQAHSYDLTAKSSKELADNWQATELRHERDGTKGTFDPRAARSEMLENMRSSNDLRDKFIFASIILVAFPLLAYVVGSAAKWIWGRKIV